MGGLAKKIPLTFWCMTIGTLALTGFPLDRRLSSPRTRSSRPPMRRARIVGAATYAFVLMVVAAGLTSFYSWRLVFMTFFGKPRWAAGTPTATRMHAHDDHAHDDHAHDDHGHGHHALDPHESPAAMMIPLLRAVGRRAVRRPRCSRTISSATRLHEFWRSSLFFGADNHILHEMHEIPEWVGMLPFLMMARRLPAVAPICIWSRAQTPVASRRSASSRSTSSCSTSGISTSFTTSCSCARPSGSAACSGRAATARSSTGSARTALPRACSTARAGSCGCRPATSIITPSRC